MVWKIIIILFTIQLALSLGHLALYVALRKFLGIEDLDLQHKLKTASIVLSLVPLVASVLVNNFMGSILNGLYYISAVWLGTFHWLCLAGISSWIIYYFTKLVGINLPNNYIGFLLFPLALLISIYGIFHSYNTKVTKYTIRIKNLPDFWQGKKVVIVSDTHLGNVRGKAFIKKIAKLANEQNPEAVFIPGDFYDGPPADYDALAQEFMGNINSKIKVFFSNGNHEEFRQNELYTSALAKSGMTVVNNKKTEMEGLQIVGTHYFGNNTNESLKNTLANLQLDINRPVILMKHAPSAALGVSESGVSLMLSGHAHKGQMWPWMHIARFLFKEFVLGHHTLGNLQVITSSGAGTWGPPQRVGSNSEIVLISFEKI